MAAKKKENQGVEVEGGMEGASVDLLDRGIRYRGKEFV